MPNFFSPVIKPGDESEIKLPKGNFGSSELPNATKLTGSSSSVETDDHQLVKIYMLGEKGSGIRLQGAIQNFDQLKEQLKNQPGKLFVDPEFPAEDSSLFAAEKPENYQSMDIVWKRPKDIVESGNPQFFVDGVSRFDVKQGYLGNCWLIAGIASTATRPELLAKVIPPNQNFEKDYAGIFRFRFWKFGKWVEVVIDDLLPTFYDSLLFAKSKEENEFWPALLEKAYAKLHGYWGALSGGDCRESLEDLTGGLCQFYNMTNAPSDLFDTLLEAQEKNALICCGINETKKYSEKQKKLYDKNLVGDHAYTITKVMYVDGKEINHVENIPFLRVRNPWGEQKDGVWHDVLSEWESIPESDKELVGLMPNEDGEFWIPFKDFKNYFDVVDICYLNPSLILTTGNKNWEEYHFEGEWVRGVTAGGSDSDTEKYQYNPQYRITLKKESTLIVALMQKNLRTQRSMGTDSLNIMYHIYEFPNEFASNFPKPLDESIFRKIEQRTNAPSGVYETGSILKALPPGIYYIVPCTYNADEEGEFLLRVFAEKRIRMKEYDVEVSRCDIEDQVIKKLKLNEREIEISRNMKERKYFRQAAHGNWELDWNEYKRIVQILLQTELTGESLGEDTCRSIVALLDTDFSGKLGYHEFQKFLEQCRIWTVAFNIYAKDGSEELRKSLKQVLWKAGYNLSETQVFDEDGFKKLKKFQLRQVLKSAGYRLNNRILNSLIRRYGDENGHVKFSNYFVCVARLEKIIANYDDLVESKKINASSLTLEEWIKINMSTS